MLSLLSPLVVSHSLATSLCYEADIGAEDRDDYGEDEYVGMSSTQ